MIEKPNFFLFTGGPGVGKTALIHHLAELGERVVEETHRAVIAEQVAAGGRALPWDDVQAYATLALSRDLAKFDALAAETGRVFFDRGLPDSFMPGFDPPPAMLEAARARRYNGRVFAFPPWREIYATDTERTQDWAEAEATFARILEGLERFGYTPMIVPTGPVEARAAFVMREAGQA
jgi:predicted ATPase